MRRSLCRAGREARCAARPAARLRLQRLPHQGHKRLAGAANHVLGWKDGKKRFADTALAMSKAFTLCCTLDEAKAVREEVAFFQAVKVILTKRDISQQKKTNEEHENAAIRQIIGSAVVSEEVVDIFDAVGLDKARTSASWTTPSSPRCATCPSAIWRSNCWSDCWKARSRRALPDNVVQGKKFSELLTRCHQALPEPRHRDRAGDRRADRDGEEVPRAAAERGDELGLNEDEIAFLRCAGRQRIRRARTERRDTEEDRPRTDREPAQET